MDSNDTMEPIDEVAAHWAARVSDPDFSPNEHARFRHWLLADDRHAAAFEQASVALAYAAEYRAAEGVPLDQQDVVIYPVVSRRMGALPRTSAVAAILLLAVVGVIYGGLRLNRFTQPSVPAHTYSTRIGEIRTVHLSDGSVAHLNTRTEMRWLEDREGTRRAELLQGEALFEVAHDAKRPFTLQVDDSEVRVMGTKFNVYRKSIGEVIVTVLEGRVSVRGRSQSDGHPIWARELHVSEQLTFDRDGIRDDVHPIDDVDVTSWKDGTLWFVGVTLGEMAKELSRYTPRPIVVRDPRVAEKKIGARILIKTVPDALASLRFLGFTVRDDGTQFVIEAGEDRRPTLQEKR